jgi:hypothetical protein
MRIRRQGLVPERARRDTIRIWGNRVLTEPLRMLLRCTPVWRGFATIILRRELALVDCVVLYSNCRAWASLPSGPQIDEEGRHQTDANSRPAYWPVREWRVRAIANHRSSAMVQFVPREHGANLDRAS